MTFITAGVIDARADLAFALKAVIECGVAFDLRMRNLDGDRSAGGRVMRAVDRSHAAGGDEMVEHVLVQVIAGL